MAGLRWPVGADHPITQAFVGAYVAEPAGYLRSDAYARRTQFAQGVYQAHLHGAVDIACPIGTAVVAPEAGELVATGIYGSTGELYAMLQIVPGTVLFFTHLAKVLIPLGSHATRGQRIALSGNTGRSTGPHLHFEVRRGFAGNDPRLSARWFKWNPERLRVGGDLAATSWIRPA